jgi:hypothetical protein
MTSWRRALFAVTVMVAAFCASAPTSAQEAPDAPAEDEVVQSWALAPAGTSTDPSQPNNRASMSYELDPGAVVEDAVTLFNYSNIPLTFDLYATDAFNDEAGSFALLPAAEKPTNVGPWIELGASRITVPASTEVTVPLTITVPKDASPGDHVGAVLASSKAEGTSPDGKAVTLDRRTGTPLYIRVAGPIEQALAVESVKTDYTPSLNPLGGEARVTYTIRNRGNVRLSGRHTVSVSGPFGAAKKTAPTEDVPELLPGEAITVEHTFEGLPATVVVLTEVKLEPATVRGEEPDLETVTRGGMTLAIPLTVILMTVAAWLGLRARRAYLRHRGSERSVEVQPT